MKKSLFVLTALVCVALGLLAQAPKSPTPAAAPDRALAQEKHLRNVRQLTFGGENAEAYFSADGKKLIFQSTREGHKCDQIYTMNLDGSDVRLVSTGRGRTTCSYFFPDGKHILYSSTHAASPDCPPPPDWSKGYRWAVYPTYEIYVANPDGSNPKPRTHQQVYNAEAVISTDGKKIAFTSTGAGATEIYTMDSD